MRIPGTFSAASVCRREGRRDVRGPCGLLLALLLVSAPALARHPAGLTPAQRTARAFAAARANPLELRAFLFRMPKGADLHNHLSGAVYAESWIRAGAEDHLCVTLATLAFAKPEALPANASAEPVCGKGQVPAARAFQDQRLYDALVDAFSMRGFVPSAGVTGHDHFFATFGKFSGTSPRHWGEWLDEVATRAAAQNEQYLELMVTPSFSHAISLARQLGWQSDLAGFRKELLARGLLADLAADRAELDQADAARRARERCGRPDQAPACAVTIRYLYQVLRGFPKQQVFAQTVLGFELASADPEVVGINYVMPEDGTIAMTDYALQMHMVGFLHTLYPRVGISLHAGELAPGLVPPEGLCCHIRLAVEQAHAERIGHGVDIMYEDHPYQLLREMTAKHVMVEINLTSNDVILGIRGADHPFPIYRKFGVPVALSTDDEGVSRIDLTHEYVRAVETYNLDYASLKQMVRTSLEHSFLPGASLWRQPDVFTRPAAACSRDLPGAGKPSRRCAAFLASSEKARQQWELERRFRLFEASD
jgi:adenosine deaminase